MDQLPTNYVKTKQETFELGANHLLTQMKRSTDSQNDLCMYNNGEGLSCGAAPFIGDLYDRGMEFHTACYPSIVHAVRENGYADHMNMIYEFQHIHDSKIPESWHSFITKLGDEHGCDGSFLEKYKPQLEV